MTTVLLAGGFGKMGLEIQSLIAEQPDLELVGILSATLHESPISVYTELDEIDTPADVWVDVTQPESAFDNATYALSHGYDLIVGTSGLSAEDVTQLGHLAQKYNRHAIIVPNFSLSAVLLMQFAEQAAKYMPDAEIIEIHNPHKLDAPSGTAKATAAKIAAAREAEPVAQRQHDAARGEVIDNVPVHAVRLPGYVAEEEVIFGAPGETLRLKQTSFTRTSFMGGVALAIRQVHQIDGLVVGLEHLL